MNLEKYLDITPELQEAIKNGEPVVALESTILSHGMPYPENLSFAAEVEKEIGVHFDLESEDTAAGVCQVKVTAVGTGSHAAHPYDGNNALTGLLTYLTRLDFAPCQQMEVLKNLLTLIPHGDVNGKNLGVAMEDEVSGELTLAFSILHVTADQLEGSFDSRCPICSNEDNVLKVVKAKMAEIAERVSM